MLNGFIIQYYAPRKENSVLFFNLIRTVCFIFPFGVLLLFRHAEPVFILILILLCLVSGLVFQEIFSGYLIRKLGIKCIIEFKEDEVIFTQNEKQMKFNRSECAFYYFFELFPYFERKMQIQHDCKIITTISDKWTEKEWISDFEKMISLTGTGNLK